MRFVRTNRRFTGRLRVRLWSVCPGVFLTRMGTHVKLRANVGRRKPTMFGGQQALVPLARTKALRALHRPYRLDYTVRAGPTQGRSRTLFGSLEDMKKQQNRYGGTITRTEPVRPVLRFSFTQSPQRKAGDA